eukprot:gnl/Spiro4/15707_TR8449_c0_g1_i1.p1 gnl/Spiro4/15707_TR8449_c0_g1~~gnl/Spiro4/15707_TR8449_c0_g1_i1.p1  ORF type:complete len:278 (-),score=58.13 gnl/Spiro4/15707_TR8449_c0_g1_i1:321-1154(-)
MLRLNADVLGVIVLNLSLHDSKSLLCTCRQLRRLGHTIEPRCAVSLRGLSVWLDAATGVSLSSETHNGSHGVQVWRSQVGDTVLRADRRASRGRSPYPHDLFDPIYIPKYVNGLPGVSFDYAHTGAFNRDIRTRTIVSVHSFDDKDRVNHMDIHGYGGELCNFYILTGTAVHHMHTASIRDPNNLSAIRSGGTIRLDGMSARPLNTCRTWIDSGPRVAVLELNELLDSGLNRIGADRNCHHYCGVLCELLVYDRVLSVDEVAAVEAYLLQKYFPSAK